MDAAPTASMYKSGMDEIMEIEPLWDCPRLVAFECPDCGHLTSVASRQWLGLGRWDVGARVAAATNPLAAATSSCVAFERAGSRKLR